MESRELDATYRGIHVTASKEPPGSAKYAHHSKVGEARTLRQTGF